MCKHVAIIGLGTLAEVAAWHRRNFLENDRRRPASVIMWPSITRNVCWACARILWLIMSGAATDMLQPFGIRHSLVPCAWRLFASCWAWALSRNKISSDLLQRRSQVHCVAGRREANHQTGGDRMMPARARPHMALNGVKMARRGNPSSLKHERRSPMKNGIYIFWR